MLVQEPTSVEDLNAEYLSFVAGRLLGDPAVQVTGFSLNADPFEFPRFGQKEFFEIPFSYRGAGGTGNSTLILRIMPPMDAVMMLTGDTEHRELKAFESGLYQQIPSGFHVPYVHVIQRPEREQFWAFLEDVRPEMQALGMHAAVPEETIRTILSHLAAFHAAFWERHDVIDETWLMSLRRPVDYFYRCVVDILDGMKEPAASTVYVTEQWPWLAEGVLELMQSLDADSRRALERLYREPENLLKKIEHMPLTLCHYDFDNRNLGIRHGPQGTQTVVIDWEILGRGLSSSDVVRFLLYQQPANMDELVDYYLDQLEERLGQKIDRTDWRVGFDLAAIVEWQIRGVLFGVMVSAPSAPVPDDQRPAMRERVFSDIAGIVALVLKYGLD